MLKIVKLSRIPVVLSTCLVLGSMMALPVAHADGVARPFDLNKMCLNEGYVDGAQGRECIGYGGVIGIIDESNDQVCQNLYGPTARYNPNANDCLV